ncbi:ATP-dependent Lon protease pim1, partial [Podochytrium sp. JEL0797]
MLQLARLVSRPPHNVTPRTALCSAFSSSSSSSSSSGRSGGRRAALLARQRMLKKHNGEAATVTFDLGDGERRLLAARLLDDATDALKEAKPEDKNPQNFNASGNPGSNESSSSSNNNNSNNNNNQGDAKLAVPKDYPQTLAIPLTRRPLFPAFYKSLYITDPNVIKAIQDRLDRKQPYVSIFLTKDEKYEPDTLVSADTVHPVGVFAQITSVYNAGPDDKALTVVVYPHRRVRLDSLLPLPVVSEPIPPKSSVAAASHGRTFGSSSKKDSESPAAIIEADSADALVDAIKVADAAAHVETSLDSKDDVAPSAYTPTNLPLSHLPVSVVNISNQPDTSYDPDSPTVKATISEILHVLKEISLMNPLLRDQILTFSIQTGGNAFQDAGKLADFAAAVSSGEPLELQAVLE